jgi:hypothetical protein
MLKVIDPSMLPFSARTFASSMAFSRRSASCLLEQPHTEQSTDLHWPLAQRILHDPLPLYFLPFVGVSFAGPLDLSIVAVGVDDEIEFGCSAATIEPNATTPRMLSTNRFFILHLRF